jgi:hypothetical protein
MALGTAVGAWGIAVIGGVVEAATVLQASGESLPMLEQLHGNRLVDAVLPSTGAVLGVHYAVRTRPLSASRSRRWLSVAGALWVGLVGSFLLPWYQVGEWLLPHLSGVLVGGEGEPRLLERRIAAGARVSYVVGVGLCLALLRWQPPGLLSRRRHGETAGERSSGAGNAGVHDGPHWRTLLGGGVLWALGGTAIVSMLRPVARTLLWQWAGIPFGMFGTAMLWFVVGVGWTWWAVGTEEQERLCNDNRLRFLAYCGALLTLGSVLAPAVVELLETVLSRGVIESQSLAILIAGGFLVYFVGVPMAVATIAYGHVIDRPGSPTTPPPRDRWVRHMISATSLHQVLAVAWIGVLLVGAVFVGAGLLGDYDNDGLRTGRELQEGTDPTRTDSDGDGIDDGREIERELAAGTADSDGDGVEDGDEERLGLDPNDPDTDGDGIEDGDDLVTRDVTELGDSEPAVAEVFVTATPRVLLELRMGQLSAKPSAGPQLGYGIWIRKPSGQVNMTVPVGDQAHQQVTAYVFRAGHNWTGQWRPLPTRYDESNETVTVDVSGIKSEELEYIVLSNSERVSAATTQTVELDSGSILSMQATTGWNTTEGVHAEDGQLHLDRTGTSAVAKRQVQLQQGQNLTLLAGVPSQTPVTVSVTNGRQTVTETATGARLRLDISQFSGQAVTITLRGSDGAAIDWLWVQQHSDGDRYSDVVEGATQSITGPFCWEREENTYFTWDTLRLDETKTDTDRDGVDDDTEVHLSWTLHDDANQSVVVSLAGYHHHPQKPETWGDGDDVTLGGYCQH